VASQPVTVPGDLYSEQDVQTKVVVPQLEASGFREANSDVKISYNHPIEAHQGRETRTIYADVMVQVTDRPFIVIDSKSPRRYLSDNDREQVISYARLLPDIAPFAALCNGHSWRVYDSITKQQVPRLPNYSDAKGELRQLPERQKVSLVNQANRTLFAIESARELSRLMHRCHDVIRNIKGYDPTKAFDELSKLLFSKMYEEREIEDGNRKVNRFTSAVVQSERQNNVDIIQKLWNDTVKSKRYREVFSDEDSKDEILLPPEAIDKIVSILEDKSLGKTDLDVKGVAFEEFLSATYRGGGLGQYFTPREVVNFMVDLVNPQIGDKTIDPSCGSGGFLIRVYDVVRDKILTSDLSPREKKNSEKELATTSLAGIDWEARAARTCKMNMIIHGDGHAGVYQGNALDIDEITEKVERRQKFCPEAPAIEENSFDIVLTNPPFGAKDDQPHILKNYELGGNSQKREVLLIERCIRLLRPGGRMAIVLPEGILSNKKDKRVRDYIRQHCIVKAIIRLSQDAFKMSEGAACTSILYAIKKDPQNPALSTQGDIFLSRAEYIGISPSGNPIDQNDLPAIREQFQRFERGEWDGIEMRPSREHRMEIIRGEPKQTGDWLEPETNRTSLLYDRLMYVIRQPKIANRFSYTYNHPKYYRLMNQLDEMPVEVVSFESLCEEGFPRRGKTPGEQSSEGIPILKVRNVTGGGISLETYYAPDTEAIRDECQRGIVCKGDVLITCTGEGTIGRVDPYLYDDTAIADGHIAICRFKSGTNRKYIEEFLKSELGQLQMLRQVIGSTGQTELLIGDVGALRIPIPQKDVQSMIVSEMEHARVRSREYVNGAKYFRERGSTVIAAARSRMISRLCGESDYTLAGADSQQLSLPNGDDLASRFRAHADRWRRQTQHMSSLTKMVSHPSYQAIIEMGDRAVPLLLEELRDRPDHWLVALNKITGQDPAEPKSTFSEAVESWLSWGRQRRYL
jgi:type I restriction-modification system DNA methylase subunit